MFIGRLEKEQELNLLGVSHVRETVVPENVGEVPGCDDDRLRVVLAHDVLGMYSTRMNCGLSQ
jgi:hypothetical protein